MADDDDEVVVHVEDAALAADLGVEPEKAPEVVTKKPAADDPVESLKSQYAVLKTQTEQTQRERDEALRTAAEANRRAEQAHQEVVTAKGQVVESQYDTVVSGISAADAEAEAATTEYQKAFEAGDGAAMGAAQRKMARAESKKTRLEEAKADIEAQQETRKTAQPEQTQQRQAPADPVEAYIQGRTPQTADWLRSHRDWVTDQKKNAKLTAAHYNAVGEGLQADTPDYFEHVETFLGLREAEKEPPKPTPRPVQQRRPMSPTTPVVHSGGGTNGQGQEVRLSRSEALAATDGTHIHNYDDPSGQKRFKKGDPIGVQEFARRKLAMMKAGQYDKTFVEN